MSSVTKIIIVKHDRAKYLGKEYKPGDLSANIITVRTLRHTTNDAVKPLNEVSPRGLYK